MPLLGHRAERLGEERQVVHHQRQLAGPGPDQGAGRAYQVSEVQAVEHQGGSLRQAVAAHEELELVLAVVEVGEHELPLPADGADAPRHPQVEGGGFQLLGGLLPVLLPGRRGFEVPLEAVGIDGNPRLRQRLPLVTPVLDLIVELGHGSPLSSSKRADSLSENGRC